MSEAPEEKDSLEAKNEALTNEHYSNAASVLTSKLALIAGTTLGEGCDVHDFENGTGEDCLPVDLETQARLEALLEAAGIGKLSTSDGKALADPDVLHRLTSTVSYALDEAAAALSRLRAEAAGQDVQRTLPEACSDGDVVAVRRLLDEGRSVHETTEDGESLLSLACSAGYFELTEVLLSMSANVEERGPKGGCTPLMEAASGGYKDIVELLIEHGADLDATSSTGNTALTFACCGGYDEIVKILIAAGADLEVQNENGHTPLMEAASGGHVSVAATLLQHGAGINTHSNEFKESALTLACYKGHLEMVQFLLQAGADQEHKTDEMHTALMEASMDGHVDVARLLLDSGAQVNMPADSFESPLTLAACGGHVELASLLLLRGANIEEVNDEGYTPLMEASREGHDKMVIVLLTHGANVNILTDETQETALTLAACGGFLECCSLLIHAGADLEGGCSTPLMEAAQEGHLELVKFLLEKGAKVDAQTSSGNTALSYACEHGRTSVAAVLLPAGACLEHESEGGRTPLMKAARAGHLCTVQYLISRGANVNKKTRNNDHTVLSLACVYGHVSVVELLLCLGADPTCMLKDGSTMLLEAAKGGHTNVVQLLLDYPKNFMNAPLRNHGNALCGNVNSPSPEQPIPRVPTQTLPLIVPPQEPDTAPFDQNFPGKTSEPMFQTAVATTLRESEDFCGMKKISRYLNPEASAEEDKSSSVDAPNDRTIVNVDHDLSIDDEIVLTRKDDIEHSLLFPANRTQHDHTTMPVSLPSPGVEQELTKLEQRIKKAIETNAKMKSLEDSQSVGSKINSMCADEDLQLLKKQRILEELQKVEQGLQEKATRQFKAKTGFEYLDFDSCCTTARGHPDGGDGLNDLDYVKDDEQSSTSDEDGNSAADDSSMTSPPLHDFLESLESKQLPQEASDEFVHMENDMGSTLAPYLAENLASLNNAEDMSNIPGIDIDCCTESNNDTPLTLACAGGHRELVHLLISRGANLEHRDKKGFSPLILAATAGHVGVVRILLDAGADIELQCVRTKDTPLSLACSGGRLEVVELLLERGANIEHRNVSDYTPLSLAASGGYVKIISLLLSAGAEINSRTGSKLGISPLMLAAMNGHTDAVHLLLDAGADINAQIETNRNTALTLACFQGRHAVVSLLVDRRANVEHRAKTGLTPLMEAASGGYAEVGRVLLEKGADVNAAPVPSSRDTALTIAADKGHLRFCELVLSRWAMVDVRNKKGNTPFWLACNGGHLDVAKLLMRNGADLNTADNRNITPLMAAFRKGHIKVVRWLSKGVSQFPSDAECMRYNATITDSELLKRCRTCMECIVAAKERQAQEANKYASELLEEIDKEKSREENRKERAARKREKRRKKRKEKQQLTKDQNNDDIEIDNDESVEQLDEAEIPKAEPVVIKKSKEPSPSPTPVSKPKSQVTPSPPPPVQKEQPTPIKPKQPPAPRIPSCHTTEDVSNRVKPQQQRPQKPAVSPQRTPGRKPQGKKDEEWKEVVRNSRSKKIIVSSSLISRVIGRGGCNIKAIREATAAHIDINKHRKGLERTITIRGPTESIRYANELISELIKDKNSDCDIQTLIQSMQRCTVQTTKPQNVPTNHLPTSNDATVQAQSPKNSPPASAKIVSKPTPVTHRRPVIKPKEIPAPIIPEIEKNVQEKFPRTSTPGLTSIISTLSVKSSEPPATVPLAVDIRNSTVPISLPTEAAAMPSQPIAVAPLPFMTRATGKPINRPVQPVAPMISLKTSPYKSTAASVSAINPPFTTASYTPVNPPNWQSSVRSGIEHQHQRVVQPMQQFDATRQQSNIQYPIYSDQHSDVNTSLMTPGGGNYPSYSMGGNQQQNKPSMWDQNPQTDPSLAPGNPPQQQLPVNNIQNNETPQQQQDRKIWPIGTERASHRRMHPESNPNPPGVWSIHDQNSFVTWTSANTQNPIWSQGVNSVPLGSRVTPLLPKQHLDESQFGNVNNNMMNVDIRNAASAPIRPESRDMLNHGQNFYQQQNINKMMMSISGVGTQPPIGSHLGNSAMDSATRSIAVAPQQMNQLPMGAFKQPYSNHVPDHLRPLMGMSANPHAYPLNSFVRDEYRREGNSNPAVMLQEQYPRFPMQNSAFMTDRNYVDRLQDVENIAAFNPQMHASNMPNANLIQKDMTMFQRGVRQPNVSSSQQKTNDTDQSMLFAGASGSVGFTPSSENAGWWS